MSEVLTVVGDGGSGPRQFDLAEVSGKVDFGIVTIREDEFRALLHYFPVKGRASGRRQYSLSTLSLPGGKDYLIAMLRCAEQGNGEAQAAAHDLLDDVKPRWLLVVGIAGGRPSKEFGLGDVVVSTRVQDFSVEAVLQGGEREYTLTGGPLHPAAIAIAADLPAREQEMQGWNSPNFLRAGRPSIVITDDRLEGPANWKKKVKDSLSTHVARDRPLFTACPIASSDRLVRDPELFNFWLKMARHVCAVEMESAGVYRATHGAQIPFLAIRGISDVVGFKRDPRWTEYACCSAAAFTHAFLRTRPIPPRSPSRIVSGDAIAGRVDEIPSPPNFYRVADYIPGHKFVGRTRELAQLTEWAIDSDPVLLFTAIGGMGKSILTWHWLTDHALKARRDWAGIFWYSFYERGSDMKAFCAHALAYTTGRSLDELLRRKTAALASELILVLHQKPWLLVLDGLERIMVAYQRFDAAQMHDGDLKVDPDNSNRRPEACVYLADDSLLHALCGATPSKLLISSRLVPKSLLNNSDCPLPGVRHIELRGLDSADAEHLLRDLDIKGDSTRIRKYLETHFACHPLVVGVVAGLVGNFLPAPRNFDRWAEHPQGGAELHLSTMNLVQRQNHILKVALSGLEPESRSLLGRLSLISDATDLDALKALNPHRPVPPEKVDPPQEWSKGSRYYERVSNAYDKYLRTNKAWKRAESEANIRLAGTIKDLEGRGLLQWDRQRNVFDLHPVVRGCAVDMLSADERVANGQKVVDYFSSRSGPLYEQASRLSDLGNGLQIVRTFLQIGRYQDAANTLSDRLADALAFNLERYHELLTLLRPFFVDGWDQPPKPLSDKSSLGRLAFFASNAFHRLGYVSRGFSIRRYSIAAAVKQKDASSVLLRVFADSTARDHDDRFYQGYRALTLGADLAVVAGANMYLSEIPLLQAWKEWRRGNPEAAAVRLREFETSKQDAAEWVRIDAERLRAWVRFDQGLLTEEVLSLAIQLAENHKERFDVRELYELRGLWLCSRSLYTDAEIAFEEALRMGREIGLSSWAVESRIALVRAKQGNTVSSLEIASRVADLAPDIEMAELYLALNDQAKATKYALAAYKLAWADGIPYFHGRNLWRCREVLGALGQPEPQLPPFDESKAELLPYEGEVLAFLEELKKNNGGNERARK